MSWRIASACLAVLLLPGAAPALEATAQADLLLRVGPGAGDRVVDAVPEGARVIVHGCVEATGQCLVHAGGRRGWVFGAALGDEGVVRPLAPEPAQVVVVPPPVIVVEEAETGFVAGEGVGIAPLVRVGRHCRPHRCRPHHRPLRTGHRGWRRGRR